MIARAKRAIDLRSGCAARALAATPITAPGGVPSSGIDQVLPPSSERYSAALAILRTARRGRRRIRGYP